MPLSAGDRLGPYEILSLLGKGGMGEVYRAHDSRLRRDVAIKTSAEQFNDRFQREARAIAALNHPNICTLYDIGPDYLVMELIEGSPPKGPLLLDDALRIADQIAAALTAAHEKGIVHRDLKPANVTITPGGLVKVLDFGLAKKVHDPAADGSTMTLGLTAAGMVVGTPAYIAPEQAQGEEVDKRADIWAFGVLLFELLTGQRPFVGGSVQSILAAVLTQDPDLEKLPAQARRLVRACLKKNPRERLSNIGDWRLLLDDETSSPGVSARSSSRAGWIAAAVCATTALAAVTWLVTRPDTPANGGLVHTYMVPPDNAAFAAGGSNPLHAISPDGRSLAFVAESGGMSSIWVRKLDAPVAHRLDATESAEGVFWAPDSRNLGFMVPDKLRRVDVETGVVRDIATSANIRGASWGNSGTILFGTVTQGIARVPEDGGAVVPVTEVRPGEQWHYYPSFLPDNEHFLFASLSGVHVGSVKIAPGQQRPSPVLTQLTNATYMESPGGSSGYLLFPRTGTLYVQPFDPKDFTLKGTPLAIADDVYADNQAIAQYSVSRTGWLATSPSQLVEVAVVSRNGERLGTLGVPGPFGTLHPSPDGKRAGLLYLGPEASNGYVRIMDLERGTLQTIPDEGVPPYLTWSPDGSEILFNSVRERATLLFRANAGGGQPAEIETGTDEGKYPFDWTRQGFVYSQGGAARRDLMLLPATPGSRPQTLVSNGHFNYGAQVSPNERWMAYVSDENGADDVYVQKFPVAAAGKYPVSQGGGTMPVWSSDGKELFYAARGQVMAVSVQSSGEEVVFGRPQRLFELAAAPRFRGATFWWPRQGAQEFLVLRNTGGQASRSIHLTQDWPALLRK